MNNKKDTNRFQKLQAFCIKKLYNQNRPEGVSLILAIVFVSIFLLVVTGLAQIELVTMRNLGDRRTEAKVEDLARIAENMASFIAGVSGEGENVSIAAGRDTNYADANLNDAQRYSAFLSSVAGNLGINGCGASASQPCVSFEVIGRPTDNAKVRLVATGAANACTGTENDCYFSVPAALAQPGSSIIKGTGEAARDCGTDPNNANNPCHWNRLYFGETTEIPLYYMNGTSPDPVKPTLTPASSFRLRMRAPCQNYAEDCAPNQRINLYPMVSTNATHPYRHIQNTPDAERGGLYIVDPVIVQWSINDAAGSQSLLAREDNETNIATGGRGGRGGGTQPNRNLRPAPDTVERSRLNTELSSGRINDANDAQLYLGDPRFVILEGNAWGRLINNNTATLSDFVSTTAQRPVLRLNLVQHPKVDDGDPSTTITIGEYNNRLTDVPYIEYQLLTTSTLSDNKSSLNVTVNIGSFRKNFTSLKERGSSLGGFSFENL